MRSGCSLPATVLLLFVTGLLLWGARHWRPNAVCDETASNWLCGAHANATGTHGKKRHGDKGRKDGERHAGYDKKGDHGKHGDRGSASDNAGGSTGMKKVQTAQALPWPVAEKSREWSNFRKGAYDIPSVAAAKKSAGSVAVSGVPHSFAWPVADKSKTWSNYREGAYDIPAVATVKKVVAAVLATGVPHPFAWPVAEKPKKWSNHRKGAYDIPAIAAPRAAVNKTVAHPYAWPVAEKPKKWTNHRKGAYDIPAVAAPKAAVNKTVAHPFPWPVADKPVKWNNVRKAKPQKKIVAAAAQSKTVPHPRPWPVAEKPVKWTNVRKPPKPARATGVAHPFPWPVADKPRKWTNMRAAPEPEMPARPAVSPSVPYADGYVSHAPAEPRNGLSLLVLRVKQSVLDQMTRTREARKRAQSCGTELNRIASAGVVLFETNSARLTRSSYQTLDRIADAAMQCRQVSITVEGHTDNSGSETYNQSLSERRAQSVVAYLNGAGVASGDLTAIGYGESRPAVPNSSPQNMAKNRRIEFAVSGR